MLYLLLVISIILFCLYVKPKTFISKDTWDFTAYMFSFIFYHLPPQLWGIMSYINSIHTQIYSLFLVTLYCIYMLLLKVMLVIYVPNNK